MKARLVIQRPGLTRSMVLVLALCAFVSAPTSAAPPSDEAEERARWGAEWQRKVERMKGWVGFQEVLNNEWMGIRTWQNPLDVWITQEILAETQPDYVVEAGTKWGGSAVLWASLLEFIKPDAKVITIDIKNMSAEARRHPAAVKRVKFMIGSSTDPETVRRVTEQVKGKKVLVILDSLHTAEHVRTELEFYAPLVNVGSYIIVQDTIGTGAILGIRGFLSENDDFEVDTSRERFIYTNNLGGYLRRIR